MKELRTVHLNGLRAAEAIGRTGSLKGASDEIGVTPGAVSQHLTKLERQIGHLLFERTSGGLRPTAFGSMVLPQLTEGFAQLERTLVMTRNHGSSVLTLSIAPNFASKWLVPRLAQFSRLHPEMRVRGEATSTLVDLDASDVDLAVRVGDGNYPEVVKTFLARQEVFPVCAPFLAERLKRPEDLTSVPILRDSNFAFPWSTWLTQFGISESDLTDGYTFTDSAICLEAAIAGQGVMLAWQFLAEDAIRQGRLAAPFEARAQTRFGYWLLQSKRRKPTPQMTAFTNWLQAEVAASFAA